MIQTARRPLVARIALTAVGSTLAMIGLLGLFLPVVPGLLLLIPGLAILGGEYVWARRLLDSARAQLDRARPRRRQSAGREAA